MDIDTPILFALTGFTVVVTAIGLSFVIMKERGSSTIKRRLPIRYHVAFSIAFTVGLITLWSVFGLWLAILPALMVPVWIPLLTRNEAASPNGKVTFASLFAGTIVLVVSIGLFWIMRS